MNKEQKDIIKDDLRTVFFNTLKNIFASRKGLTWLICVICMIWALSNLTVATIARNEEVVKWLFWLVISFLVSIHITLGLIAFEKFTGSVNIGVK